MSPVRRGLERTFVGRIEESVQHQAAEDGSRDREQGLETVAPATGLRTRARF